ncbi:hypothetical protein ACFQY5_36820 [Paeniroseomonas aquatica]
MRATALRCYPGWQLVEALVTTPSPGVVALLWDGGNRTSPLFGVSNSLHLLNATRPPKLDPEAATEYLKLFCHHVWADAGAFHIIEDPGVLEVLGVDPTAYADELRLQPVREGKNWLFRALVEYSGVLFSAKFRVRASGMVDMLEDNPIQDTQGMPLHCSPRFVYDRPFRKPAATITSNAPPAGEWPVPPVFGTHWTALPEASCARVQAGLRRYDGIHMRIPISLVAARVGPLDDDGGMQWGDQVRLSMQGFVYEQLDTPDPPLGVAAQFAPPVVRNTSWKLRRDWLHLQRPPGKGWTSPDDFDSEQHAQVARLYRTAGRLNDAREIISDQMQVEGMLQARDFATRWKTWLPIATALATCCASLGISIELSLLAGILAFLLLSGGRLLLHELYRLSSGFGLRPAYAIATFQGLLLVGWGGVLCANRDMVELPAFHFLGRDYPPLTLFDLRGLEQVLFVETSLGRDVVLEDPGDPGSAPKALIPFGGRGATPIPCGDSIQPFLYAADVFIPLLDLRQEIRCSPRDGAVLWHWAKALYATLGWIVTSLTILTVTGVLRERLER